MENTRENELNEVEESQIKKIKFALDKVNNKESNFLFFIAKINNPAASIYEIYFHATTVKKLGYKVRILTDSSDYEIPDWIETELTDFPHESMEQAKLTVGTQDVIIIPEIFSNVMEQTKNLPCVRIGLLQSFDYMLNGLLPGTDWNKDFGIKHIITTSNEMKQLLIQYYGENTFNIKTYDIGIPNYFKVGDEIKRPVISVVGRNPNEISKIVKLFYTKFPQYSWITFDSMITDSKPQKPLRRMEYAERLRKNFAAVWIDRISSFGTFPLECMKSGTITIGLIPDIVPQYLITDEGKIADNVGVWSRDIYAIPLLIGDVVTKFLDDSIDENINIKMEELSSKYNQENAEKQLGEIYTSIINERATVLSGLIDDYNKKKESEAIIEATKEEPAK